VWNVVIRKAWTKILQETAEWTFVNELESLVLRDDELHYVVHQACLRELWDLGDK
jgi:hypothetical protein